MVLIVASTNRYLPVELLVYYTVSFCIFIGMSIYLWTNKKAKEAFSRKVEFKIEKG